MNHFIKQALDLVGKEIGSLCFFAIRVNSRWFSASRQLRQDRRLGCQPIVQIMPLELSSLEVNFVSQARD
jgi:hypothetical protein